MKTKIASLSGWFFFLICSYFILKFLVRLFVEFLLSIVELKVWVFYSLSSFPNYFWICDIRISANSCPGTTKYCPDSKDPANFAYLHQLPYKKGWWWHFYCGVLFRVDRNRLVNCYWIGCLLRGWVLSCSRLVREGVGILCGKSWPSFWPCIFKTYNSLFQPVPVGIFWPLSGLGLKYISYMILSKNKCDT